MAEVVEDFTFTRPSSNRPEQYPWSEWLDGRVWKLEYGVDFEGADPNVFRNTVAAAAKRRGLSVRTSLHGEEDGPRFLYIQAFSKSGENGSAPEEKASAAYV